jgi:hypothetical protein
VFIYEKKVGLFGICCFKGWVENGSRKGKGLLTKSLVKINAAARAILQEDGKDTS